MIDRIPEISCSLYFIFNSDLNIQEILEDFREIGLCELKIKQEAQTNNHLIIFSHINYEKFWYLDDALSKIFSKIKDKISFLKEILTKFNATALVDVTFHSFGTFPELTFTGKNMQIIHELKADISIDPY